MKLFLDANILIDLIKTDRKDISTDQYADYISKIGYQNLYVSALSVHIVFYVLKLKFGSAEFHRVKLLLELINILPVGEQEIRFALNTPFTDFEDSLQYFTALDRCDAILTSDSKDFIKINETLGQNLKVYKNWKELF